jgi:hypothetical protein
MNYKFMGTSEDITECQLCGKVDLKRTVALKIENTIVYYGTHCAAKALGNGTSGREIASQAKVIEKAIDWIKAEYPLSDIACTINTRYYAARTVGNVLFISDFAAINTDGELIDAENEAINFIASELKAVANLVGIAEHHAAREAIVAESKAQFGIVAKVTGNGI